MVNSKCDENLDMRTVYLNNMKLRALFDSGSSINIITRKFLRRFKNLSIEKLDKNVEIRLLNGSCIKSKESVFFNTLYKVKNIDEKFFIINNGIVDVIIGQKLIKKLTHAAKNFPIECMILTKNENIVSWSRPIKNFRDKEDFKKLISEYETKGIIEKSKSLWLNPIVLNRKKTRDLRFTLDLRKVNELVGLDKFELPNIQHLIRSLHGMKYFSVLYLKDGYFQVPLSVKDREKTTFLDPNQRMLQFTKMPQGYKNICYFPNRNVYDFRIFDRKDVFCLYG
ncbi:Transposon Ty3-G Gag-Pol polyprotein [Dictyocoela muelleri]|nr:Transposon Ty3-G Gag-Pol polyprotein [Dictyocoela muelleri]